MRLLSVNVNGLCQPAKRASLPAFYSFDALLPFYAQVVRACALIGFLLLSGYLVSDSSHRVKSFYLSLLMNPAPVSHCVVKFRKTFGDLYWSQTRKDLYIMPIDRKVIDTNWKIAHGVLYTADRLRSFNMAVDPLCFCNQANDSAQHLFFDCSFITSLLLWAQSIFAKVTAFQLKPSGATDSASCLSLFPYFLIKYLSG